MVCVCVCVCVMVCVCGVDTACCRNPYDQVFYYFDDHEVKRASASHLKVSLSLELCIW